MTLAAVGLAIVGIATIGLALFLLLLNDPAAFRATVVGGCYPRRCARQRRSTVLVAAALPTWRHVALIAAAALCARLAGTSGGSPLVCPARRRNPRGDVQAPGCNFQPDWCGGDRARSGRSGEAEQRRKGGLRPSREGAGNSVRRFGAGVVSIAECSSHALYFCFGASSPGSLRCRSYAGNARGTSGVKAIRRQATARERLLPPRCRGGSRNTRFGPFTKAPASPGVFVSL